MSGTSSTNTQSQSQFKVQLAIYDLSQGMAQNLSRQFLGPNHVIDMIPHSGVLVHGMEYYFGGGIQSSRPDVFSRQHGGMQPVMMLDVGVTNVTKADFERWLRHTASMEYSPTSYDLLQRNCNNFADYALRDGLNCGGVPQWVLDVPSTFLSSPLGGMLRPMLEGMQMSAPPVGAGGVGSSSNTGSTLFTAPPATAAAMSTTSTTNTNNAIPAATNNPWANINSSASPSISATTTTTKATATAVAAPAPSTPLLDSHTTKPLLSTDTATVPLAISKLKQATQSAAAATSNDNAGWLTEEEANSVGQALDRLQVPLLQSSSSTALVPADAKDVRQSLFFLLERSLSLEHPVSHPTPPSPDLKKSLTSILSYTLMLLRLLVLRKNSSNSRVLQACINLLVEGYFISVTSGSSRTRSVVVASIKETSVMVTSMAWCVLSNAVGGGMKDENDNESNIWTTNTGEQLLDLGIADCLHHAKKEVRQAASAFLYNYALLHQNQNNTNNNTNADDKTSSNHLLSDVMVALLCSAIDNLAEEQDELVVFRRLLLVATLVQSQATALSLCIDLGLEQVCRDIIVGQEQRIRQQNSIQLATELCVLLSSSNGGVASS
jgi:hypothetical protein